MRGNQFQKRSFGMCSYAVITLVYAQLFLVYISRHQQAKNIPLIRDKNNN